MDNNAEVGKQLQPETRGKGCPKEVKELMQGGNGKWGGMDLSGMQKERLILMLLSWSLQLPIHCSRPGVLKNIRLSVNSEQGSKDLKLRPVVRNLCKIRGFF